MYLCLETLVKSVPEGIVGGLAAGLAIYKAYDDLYTSLRNGCTAGLFWAYGRTLYANHSIKCYYSKSKERQSVFSDVIPTLEEATEIGSKSLLQRERLEREHNKLSNPDVNAPRLQTLAEKIRQKKASS